MRQTWTPGGIVALMAALILNACNPGNVKLVSQDGKGDFQTIQEAIDAIPEGNTEAWTVKVGPGEYYEKVRIPAGKGNLTLVGAGAGRTVLWSDDYAGSGIRGQKAALAIDADDVTVARMTIKNTHVNIREIPGENSRSQAQAVSIGRCDRVAFYDCRITGYQDTFYANGGRVYLSNCYVEGNVDFIYGAATMVFDKCEIFANQHDSYLTAASTQKSRKFGINFLDCTLSAKNPGEPDADGVPFYGFYLGRPWHNFARVAFIRCHEPATLYPAGWTFMNSGTMPHFYEYKCTGPGATTERLLRRVMGRQLTDDEAAAYTVENIFSKDTDPLFTEDWKPSAKFGR